MVSQGQGGRKHEIHECCLFAHRDEDNGRMHDTPACTNQVAAIRRRHRPQLSQPLATRTDSAYSHYESWRQSIDSCLTLVIFTARRAVNNAFSTKTSKIPSLVLPVEKEKKEALSSSRLFPPPKLRQKKIKGTEKQCPRLVCFTRRRQRRP